MTLNLVTGGAGFVGRRLVAALLARGEAVRVLDLNPCPVDGAEAIVGSISNATVVAEATRGATRVFHLAGVADLWARDPSVFERVNVEGTRTVLNAALAAGAERFVFCSSATTLVGERAPIGISDVDETNVLAPDDLVGAYPRSKRRAELVVEAAAARGGPALIVNPTEPLGPGDDNLTPPTKMILDFVNGATPAYIDCTLNFAPVDDLAAGMIAAATRGRPGERYILAGEDAPMRALLATLADATGRPMPRLRLPYAAARAVAAIDEGFVARLTGAPPKAPIAGVKLAGRQTRFSRAKAAQALDWRSGPYEPALIAMLRWAREKGLTDADVV